MLVICSLLITINAGGIPWMGKFDAKGKVLSSSKLLYLVDFSHDLDRYNLFGNSQDYSKVLIDKSECVRINK